MSGHCPLHPFGCGACPACQKLALASSKAQLAAGKAAQAAWAKAH